LRQKTENVTVQQKTHTPVFAVRHIPMDRIRPLNRILLEFRLN